MVRAPCCEKMGLKKGPWTSQEDHILISYIQKHGHGNWRALPKQAGLLRCGKSCRLRWTNYLRPDIKRGNFSKEEEEAIIKLHEMLGNRWSAIAARLPGRTDNEIKNVWHTHLKKRLKNCQGSKIYSLTHKARCESNFPSQSEPENSNFPTQPEINSPLRAPISPQRSSSEISSITDSSTMTTVTNNGVIIKNEHVSLPENFLEIDESFWLEELSAENSSMQSDFFPAELQFRFPLSHDMSGSKSDDGMEFWYDLFLRAGDVPELPDF